MPVISLQYTTRAGDKDASATLASRRIEVSLFSSLEESVFGASKNQANLLMKLATSIWNLSINSFATFNGHQGIQNVFPGYNISYHIVRDIIDDAMQGIFIPLGAQYPSQRSIRPLATPAVSTKLDNVSLICATEARGLPKVLPFEDGARSLVERSGLAGWLSALGGGWSTDIMWSPMMSAASDELTLSGKERGA